MNVPIGNGGIRFLDEGYGENRTYQLKHPGISWSPQFTRDDLAHLRNGAALFDPHAETDAVYNGPKFIAFRVCRPPAFFGVTLQWMEDDGMRATFPFQGDEWKSFLELLDTICASGRVA